MKKRILTLAAILGASVSIAQVSSMKNKKGFEILPEAGDYAIQVDATPFLNFGLNAINIANSTGGTGSVAGINTFQGLNGVNTTVRGKYFTSATEAYRVNFGINTSTMKYSRNITSTVDPDDEMTVDSTVKFSQIIIGGGKEWRRGHNRLQGFYGGELNLTIGSTTPLRSVELSEDIEDAADDYGYTGMSTLPGTASYIKSQKGSSFGFMLNGFAGIEYFVLPKLSIGGQLSWGLMFQSKTKVTTVVEFYDGTDTNEDESEITGGPSNFGFGTNYSGQVFATFHF